MFKQALFALDASRRVEPVDTPAGRTYVRTMTVAEKDAFDLAVTKEGNGRAQLLIACCCDERGNPEFDGFDVGAINKLPVRVVEPIVDAILRFNRISADDAEALRKN